MDFILERKKTSQKEMQIRKIEKENIKSHRNNQNKQQQNK